MDYKDDKPSLVPYLLISVICHLIILVLIPRGWQTQSWQEKIVEVFPVIEKEKVYEIADIAKPAIEKKPKSARFLGMYDSSVDEETVAAGQEKGKQSSNQAIERSNNRAIKQSDKQFYNINRKLFAAKTPDFDSEAKPSSPASALEDFYPDYHKGADTYLNVLRYPDVEYFVRMKRQFKMTFNPAPALREYFSMNRVMRGSIDVVLAVSVDKDGSLAELFILNSSGVSSYDQEAMRTVRASAPFATPPDKFLADDGVLRMSWTFSVYL